MKIPALIACVCPGALIIKVPAADTNALQFVNPEVRLGALTHGQEVSISFTLTFTLANSSDQAVKIAGTDTGCHCTPVQKAPDEIPAHGTGSVEVNFNSSRSDGQVVQTVIVETAGGQIITAQFYATVGAGADELKQDNRRDREAACPAGAPRGAGSG